MEHPTGKAIILCEQVLEDRHTGNKTLVGIFNQVFAERFPAQHPKMAVYVALVCGSGDVEISLVLKSGEETLINQPALVRFESPNQVVEIIFAIRGLQFERAGEYVIEVYAGESYIFETKFWVVQATPPVPR